MNTEELTRFMNNIGLEALREEPYTTRIEGKQPIFRPYDPFDPVSLEIVSTFVQDQPEQARYLRQLLGDDALLTETIQNWYHALPPPEAIEAQQTRIRGKTRGSNGKTGAHYPHGRGVYEACSILEHVALGKPLPEFRALPDLSSNHSSLTALSRVILRIEVPLAKIRGVPDSTMVYTGEENTQEDIPYVAITGDMTVPLVSLLIVAFNPLLDKGSVYVRMRAIAYDAAVKGILLDTFDEAENPVSRRFDRSDLPLLRESLERDDFLRLTLYHEDGHRHAFHAYQDHSKHPAVLELLAESETARRIAESPDKTRLTAAKWMDLLARTTNKGPGNYHHSFLEAYMTDNPSRTLLDMAHRENEKIFA